MEQFLPLILIGGLMYFVLILPQQRRTREHKALLSSLEVDDEVVLNSGIHGFVTAVDGEVIWLEVAPNTELKVSKSAVAGKVDPVTEDGDDSAKDSAKDDASELEDTVDDGDD